MAQSAAFLKRLRKKFGLGEYRRRRRGETQLQAEKRLDAAVRRQRVAVRRQRKYPPVRRRPGTSKFISPLTPFGKTGHSFSPFSIKK